MFFVSPWIMIVVNITTRPAWWTKLFRRNLLSCCDIDPITTHTGIMRKFVGPNSRPTYRTEVSGPFLADIDPDLLLRLRENRGPRF
jgi:hypothetical protein